MDSDAEFALAREAVRRGWVDEGRVSICLREAGPAGLLDALRDRGWLDGEQVRRLREGVPPDADDEASSNVLVEGDLIAGRYRIERILEGGFGSVYLCESAALKTPLRRHLLDDEVLRMFRDEALKWIGLGAHPNIVYAYGLEEFLRLPFLVMERVEGGRTLKEVERGPASALRYGVQVARGLDHAGKVCGLVHRDLKPANVLVTPEGVAKVGDFGLALTGGRQDGQVVGTPLYMAPEQWDGSPAVDVRADLYAFGLILYELATGTYPFEAAGLDELREAHLRRPPPRFDSPLAPFILRCLEKDPRRRPRDFEEAVLTLESLGAPRSTGGGKAPALVDGLINKAVTLERLGRFAEAVAAARDATRRAPERAEAWVALATALGSSGDPAGAYRVLSEIEARTPEVLMGLAWHAFQAGRRAEAERWLDETRERVPAERMERITSLFVELGRVEAAIHVCERVLEKDPKAVMAWNTKAVALRRAGDLPGALECARRAVELNPRYAKAWSNHATILVELELFEEALWSADCALAAEPRTAGAWCAKGAALAGLGRASDGLRCLEEGLSAMPGDPLLTRALQRARTL